MTSVGLTNCIDTPPKIWNTHLLLTFLHLQRKAAVLSLNCRSRSNVQTLINVWGRKNIWNVTRGSSSVFSRKHVWPGVSWLDDWDNRWTTTRPHPLNTHTIKEKVTEVLMSFISLNLHLGSLARVQHTFHMRCVFLSNDLQHLHGCFLTLH